MHSTQLNPWHRSSNHLAQVTFNHSANTTRDSPSAVICRQLIRGPFCWLPPIALFKERKKKNPSSFTARCMALHQEKKRGRIKGEEEYKKKEKKRKEESCSAKQRSKPSFNHPPPSHTHTHTPKSFITNATTSAMLQTVLLRIKFCKCALVLGGKKK